MSLLSVFAGLFRRPSPSPRVVSLVDDPDVFGFDAEPYRATPKSQDFILKRGKARLEAELVDTSRPSVEELEKLREELRRKSVK